MEFAEPGEEEREFKDWPGLMDCCEVAGLVLGFGGGGGGCDWGCVGLIFDAEGFVSLLFDVPSFLESFISCVRMDREHGEDKDGIPGSFLCFSSYNKGAQTKQQASILS